jgi:hypothetical protein
MVGRILAGCGALLGYLCIATVLAEALALAYLSSQGKLDEAMFLRIVAAANGIDRPAAGRKSPGEAGADDERQVSLEDLARARALRSRDLELREESLANNVAVVKNEYDKLVDEKDRYERIKAAFRAQLDEMKEGVLANNRETARLILESIQPKQAKDQILRMVKEGEMEDVVSMLSLMPSTKRAKIIKEFKTDEEAATLAEILQLIREGVPEADLIDDAQRQLEQGENSAGT